LINADVYMGKTKSLMSREQGSKIHDRAHSVENLKSLSETDNRATPGRENYKFSNNFE
jgi:hypothetical protein